MSASPRSALYRVALFICVASFLIAAFQIYRYVAHQGEITGNARHTILVQAGFAAAAIGERSGPIQEEIEHLADQLSAGALGRGEVEVVLRRFYEDFSDTIFEVGIAYQPGTSCTAAGMDAPHYGMKGDEPRHFAIEQYYDPPYLEWRWFKDTIASGPRWIEPYLGGATRELVVGFASPFYCPGDSSARSEPAGVVRANVSLTHMRERLLELRLGRTGYGFILSGEGTYVAHPVAAYLSTLTNVFDRKNVRENPELREFVTHGLEVGETLIEYRDPASGQDSWLVLTPVPGTNWTLGAVFYKREVTHSATE